MVEGRDIGGLSRRGVMGGLGAAVGAAAAGVTFWPAAGATPASASSPTLVAAAMGDPGTLMLAAPDFVPTDFYPPTAGALLGIASDGGLRANIAAFITVTAPVHLPAGSQITEVVAVANPASGIHTFSFTGYDALTQTATPIASAQTAPVNAVTQTVLTTSHVIDPARTYAVTLDALIGAVALFGVKITYSPPAAGGFVAINPSPRVFNTRDSHTPKLGDGEERVVPLGVPGATTAVFNLTVTETDAPGGYVACFPANATWPGNSNINWFGSGQNIANTTVCATDGAGQIRVRGGAAPTHVIIDVLGYLA